MWGLCLRCKKTACGAYVPKHKTACGAYGPLQKIARGAYGPPAKTACGPCGAYGPLQKSARWSLYPLQKIAGGPMDPCRNQQVCPPAENSMWGLWTPMQKNSKAVLNFVGFSFM